MTGNRPKLWALLVLVLGGAGAFASTQGNHVEAADHLDPPHRVSPDPTTGAGAAADREADIADVYAWTNADEHLVVAMSFDGPNAPAALDAVPCDPDVLYEIHIDTDIQPFMGTGDEDEFTIQARFGMDDVGNCMVQFSGIPGLAAGSTLEGAVEHTLQRGETQAYAGLRDDAFFFDLEGFRTTLGTGTLSVSNDRDFFAGLNTPVMVIEVPTSDVTTVTASTAIRVWGSTSRAPAP
jgi:hypothetical protein